jgi:hypothetical protein
VGIKYWMLDDPRPEVERRLGRLERRLHWHPQTHLDLLARIEKLGGGLLALKEVEYLGQAHPGPLDERIGRLTASEVERLERQHLGKNHDGWLLERIRRLRQQLSRRLLDERGDAARLRKDLADLLFCENLNAQSLEYLHDDPSPERLTETLQRIEETITDGHEIPVAPMGVTALVGPPLDAQAFGEARRQDRTGDAPVRHLRGAIQALVDRLREQGPPGDWGCPPRQGSGVRSQGSGISPGELHRTPHLTTGL